MGQITGSPSHEENPAVGDNVGIEAPQLEARFLLLCEHASSHIPERFAALGLEPDVTNSHVAWDIGALAVALRLSALLDAPLIYPTASRLVIDCNRALDHPGLIVGETEFGSVPGNLNLAPDEREQRIAAIHRPFHEAVDDILASRQARNLHSCLISIHSFTPTFRGRARPWHFGLIYDNDDRLALQLRTALIAAGEIQVALNQPYCLSDGVYYSLARHGEANGLLCVMIEIRDDLIRTSADQERITGQLADALLMVEIASDNISRASPREIVP